MTLNRRGLMASGLSFAALGTAGCAKAPTHDGLWYIGTYSGEVYCLTKSEETAGWKVGPSIKGLENVSFGLTQADSKKVWLLHESGSQSALSRQSVSDNTLTQDGRWPVQGDSPCYISADKTGAYLAVANYMSGNVVVWRTGEAPEIVADLPNSGKGVNPERQEGPHAHWVQFSPDNRRIYSVDLGTDEILMWPFDAATGKVGDKVVAFQVPAGAGPRHMLFHWTGTHAYILTELGNTLITVSVQADGRLSETQTISSLPPDFEGRSFAAHLACDPVTKVLYASNRGHNSIGVFAIGDDATLSPKQWENTGGDWPRFFRNMGDGTFWVANQKSNDLVLFDVAKDGTLSQNGVKLSVPSPIFIGDWPSK